MGSMPVVLSIKGLNAYYGKAIILRSVSIDVEQGKRVAILGRNGMGKSTLIKSILGLSGIRREGDIAFEGSSIFGKKTYEIAAGGIAYVPQGWQLFSSLSVHEHLVMAYRPKKSGDEWTPQRVYDCFPELKDRRKVGGTRLSGGEQQILAIARALVTNSRMILMDEPSEGISTLVLERIIDICRGLTERGVGLLLVEQNLDLALRVAQKAYVLVNGQIVLEKDVDESNKDKESYHQYLGI
jgi:branched-chain amino acid transport system ATP-binding protein